MVVDAILPRPGLREEYLKFGLPVDLRGKVVVELYSGGVEGSMGKFVEESGGVFVSVDKNVGDITGVSFVRDALLTLNGFSDDSADFVLMNHPTWWGGDGVDGLADITKTIDIVEESMRVIKKLSGNFVVVGNGFSQAGAEFLMQQLNERGVMDGWIVEWGEELHYVGQKNQEFSQIKIVRK